MQAGRLEFGARSPGGGAGLGPAGVQQPGAQDADFARQGLVTRGLAGLPPQTRQIGRQFAGQILQPLKIGLGGADPQLGLVSASVQARDAGRFLQHPPAVLRPRRDQFGDLPLTHQGRRIGPGGGVGEQQLHIAGPPLGAVDAI